MLKSKVRVVIKVETKHNQIYVKHIYPFTPYIYDKNYVFNNTLVHNHKLDYSK